VAAATCLTQPPAEPVFFTQCISGLYPTGSSIHSNAQALVDTQSLLVVVPHATQAVNDKEQVESMLECVARLARQPPG